MFGVLLVLLSVIVICALIVKKFYPAWSLFVVGLVTVLIVALVTGDPVATGKKATGFLGFDILGIFSNLLTSRTGGLGMNIMIIGGFGYYMSKIGATSALVHVCTKPMSLINSPYIIMVLGYVVGQCLNVVLGSAVGLAILMMVTVYPLMLSAGVSRQSACASVAMTGAFGLSPLGANNLMATKLTGIHVMNIFVDYQLVIAPVVLVIICIVHYFVQRYFDKKDLATGHITAADFVAKDLSEADKSEKAPAYYAIFPLVPLAFLFIFSPLVYDGIKLDIITAVMASMIITFVIDCINRRNLKESFANIKVFFEGMGKIFSSTVVLIVCAEMFAAGLTRSGGIATLIDAASNFGGGYLIVYAVMFAIIGLSTFVMGSGNAAFFSFAPMIPGICQAVGGNAQWMLTGMQLSSGCIRSMSPISGCVIAISGLANISPFEIVRRTAIPMLTGFVCIFIMSSILVRAHQLTEVPRTFVSFFVYGLSKPIPTHWSLALTS